MLHLHACPAALHGTGPCSHSTISRPNGPWILQTIISSRVSIEQLHVTSQTRRLTEMCGKNVWHLQLCWTQNLMYLDFTLSFASFAVAIKILRASQKPKVMENVKVNIGWRFLRRRIFGHTMVGEMMSDRIATWQMTRYSECL